MAEKKNPKGPSLQDAVPDEHREMAAIVEKLWKAASGVFDAATSGEDREISFEVARALGLEDADDEELRRLNRTIQGMTAWLTIYLSHTEDALRAVMTDMATGRPPVGQASEVGVFYTRAGFEFGMVIGALLSFAVPGVDRDKVVESIREVREVILQVEANESDVRQAVASLARDIELERLLRIEEQVPGGSKEGRYGKEKGYVH